MRGVDRTRRVGELIRRELASIIARVLTDRALGFISITAVLMSRDLQRARIFVTCLAAQKEHNAVVSQLNEQAAELRRALGSSLNLRRTPELTFEYDASIARGARLSRIIDELELQPRDEEDGA